MAAKYRPAQAPIVSRPTGPHTASVIWLHGLGDTGKGWADVGDMFSMALPSVKLVFPTSSLRPITLNGGMTMYGWLQHLCSCMVRFNSASC